MGISFKGAVKGVGLVALAFAVCLAPLSAKDKKGGGKRNAEAAEGSKVVMGVVSEIDAKAGTVVIDGKTLKVGEKSAFFPAGKKEGATLGDFKKDDKVTASYIEKDGAMTLVTLSIQSAEKSKKKKKNKGE